MRGSEDSAIASLVDQVYRRTGVEIDARKYAMVSSRLRRRCRELGLADLQEYWDLLRTLDDAAEEVGRFVDAVTTHKTSFFRTRGVWDTLREDVGRRASAGERMAFWSAACSTGEEPASIALLAASITEEHSGFSWSVEASDVSPVAVSRASTMRFSSDQIERAIESRPEIGMDRWFEGACEGDRRLAATLRRRVTFREHNLFDAPRRGFDVVLVRNVLIYFNESDTKRVLGNCIGALRPKGLLVIGESESLAGRDSDLEYVAPCIYRKSN
ncbi:MAG: protein-glutamate O-methyltransferase CheR [Planctomycetota bacterium]